MVADFLKILSDLFVNLAAGWLGATIIFPIFNKEEGRFDWFMLLTNIFFAILSLGVAYFLIYQTKLI